MSDTTRSTSAANDAVGLDGPTLVVDELLCYAFCYVDMFPADTICGVITHFYHAEAIRESKVKLYEGYSRRTERTCIAGSWWNNDQYANISCVLCI